MKRIFYFIFSEIRKIGSKIFFIPEEVLFSIPPDNYMIEGANKMSARSASHGKGIS